MKLIVSLQSVRLFCVFLLAFQIRSDAITFSGNPRFTPSANAPLAGTLTVQTDIPSRISVAVTDGTNSWVRNFFDYGTSHQVPLAGFRPNRTNQITVTARDAAQNEVSAPDPLTFLTHPLPAGFPVINVLVSKPELMEPGYNLFRSVNIDKLIGYIVIFNNSGEVLWYSSVAAGSDVKQLTNGDLFTPATMAMEELNLLGNKVQQWQAATGYPIDAHEAISTPRNTFLYISPLETTLPGFPASLTDPTPPATPVKVQYDTIVEMAAGDSGVVSKWSLFDLLDPYRVTYLTYTKTPTGDMDTEHSNAILEDPRDGSVVVSIRDQNAVIKFDRATGQLKWILGPPENWSDKFQPYLLKPVGTPFEWNYGQHAPIYTPQGTLMLYDDGNFRATPPNPAVPDDQNYSRAVEYQIDEDAMTVRQVWEYGSSIPEPLYTGSVGNASPLPQTGNVLITFGNVSYVNHQHPSLIATNASLARIKEVTHEENPEVVFDLAVFDYQNKSASYHGNYVYRTYRIADLYPHPLASVTDLSTFIENGFTHVRFSADPVRNYVIESSADLINWDVLSSADLDENGNCDFLDEDSENAPTRFYRIETR